MKITVFYGYAVQSGRNFSGLKNLKAEIGHSSKTSVISNEIQVLKSQKTLTFMLQHNVHTNILCFFFFGNSHTESRGPLISKVSL